MIRSLLILILAIGFLLRVTLLGINPAGVTADEIQQGYSAYSILKTARDEWGDFLPLNPRSLGDYKPPLYIYLTVPFEALLGLNILSIRLPSAIAGSLTVWVIYLLAWNLFKSRKIAILAGLFTALSYWHITYSRFGWESNIGLLFFCLGLLFFLKSLSKNYFLVFSALFFGLSILSYQAFKVFTPLFIFGLVIFYFKDLKKLSPRILSLSSLVMGIFILILVHGWIFSGSGRRAADAAIYNLDNLSGLRQLQGEDRFPPLINKLINNKPTFLFNKFIENYFGYFSTTFLVSSQRSDSSLFNLPGRSLIPSWQLILFILGTVWLFREKDKSKLLLLFWLFLSPIPASLTKDYMQTLRVESFLMTIPIVAAFGLGKILEFLKPKYVKFALGMVVLFVSITFLRDLDFYISHQFNKQFGGLKYGYEEAVMFTEQEKGKYDKIFFTKYNSNPQVFVAYYSKMDPEIFQKYAQDWRRFETEGFKFVDMIDMKLGKYYFENIDWSKHRNYENSLIVGGPEDFPVDVKIIKTISDPSGKIIFKVAESNP